MNPYLQMLLSRRHDAPIPVSEIDSATVDGPTTRALVQEPTIPLSRQRRVIPDAQPPVQAALAQEPTIPIAQPNQSPMIAPAADPTIALQGRPRRTFSDVQPMGSSDAPFGTRDRRTQPRDYVADDAQYLRDVESEPRSKWKGVGEALAQYGGSMVGLNVKGLLHPRGTKVEQARRQLNTSIGLQDQQRQEEQGQTTIALQSAQARKIDEALANPDLPDTEKAELVALKESLRMHPQPFDANDPTDAILLERAKRAGILIPSTYGKQPKGETGFTLRPGDVRHGPDGKVIASVPGVEKPEKPDDSGFTNAQLDEAVSGAKGEQAKIDAGLAQVAEQLKASPALVNGYPNTERATLLEQQKDGLRRRQQLDDQIRDWRVKRKAPKAAANSSNGTRPAGTPWSASRWAAANPGGDVEAAKAAARAAKLRVVD